MNCLKCNLPMSKIYINLTTGKTLWKCRTCGHKELVNGKTPSNSTGKSSVQTEYKESSTQ